VHLGKLEQARTLRGTIVAKPPWKKATVCHYAFTVESMRLKFIKLVPQFLRLLVSIRLLVYHQDLAIK
jgi:hypothetical protein